MYLTFRQTIQNPLDTLNHCELDSGQQRIVKDRAQHILSRVEEAPKTMRWRMRARVGENVPWYELPVADKGVVNWQRTLR